MDVVELYRRVTAALEPLQKIDPWELEGDWVAVRCNLLVAREALERAHKLLKSELDYQGVEVVR
jgi:hypothetical protein